jgi:EpsI family protein
MNRALLRSGVVASLMVLSAAAAVYMAPPEADASLPVVSLEQVVPQAFGEWKVDRTVVPVPMSADVEDALFEVYDAVLARTYVNPRGERVMLSLGYTRQQGGKQKPHWQEICYRAQGFSVDNLTRQAVRVAGRQIPVTRMVATQRTRIEPVTYWVTLGNHVVKDRVDRLERLLLMGLRRETSDGYMVRISNIADSPEPAFAAHMRFAEELAGALSTEQSGKLFGQP